MRRGIGVSPGVVVGVAHRVESVFGPFEAADPGEREPGRGRSRAIRSRRRRRGGRLRGIHSNRSPQDVGNSEAEIFKSHLQIVNDPSLRSKVRTLIENQRLTALVGLAGGDEQLRRPVRPDQAGEVSRANDRHSRRDPDDRVAPEPAERRSGPSRSSESTATATAMSRSSWWRMRSFPARR